MFAAGKTSGGSGAPAATVDAQFNYVTMLLHGDGTNGAQNNTFLDGSTNNYTITRNGNTTQGSFSPYGSNWSNYFDGTGDYLTVASNAAFAFGTNDFTWEAWVYLNSTSGQRTIYSTNATNGFIINNNSGTITVRQFGVTDLLNSAVAINADSWNHIAVARSGTTLSLWLNGSRSNGGTITNSTNFTQSGLLIGVNDIGTGLVYGYISNLRVVKGTAVYDPTQTTITVPTAPLTAITNTSLLTCADNRFIDDSTNNFAITVNGDTSVQRFNPFGTATAYSTATIGGSGYFDGSGDYLVSSGTGSFNPRSTFTVEFWTYPISNNTVTWINSNTNNNFYFETLSTTLFVGDGIINTISASAPTVNQWTHLLLSFDGTTYRLFYNGVSQATSTNLLQNNVISAFRIGQKQDGTRPFNGYITDMRVLVGTALYTSAFTPPTAPITAITNTSLLLNYINGAIFDNAMMNDLETVGNAQISTSVYKYGTGSMSFNGTNSYLTLPYGPTQNFGTGNFTIEGWVYLNSLSASYYVVAGTWTTGTTDEWLIQISNGNTIRFLTTAGTSFYSATITTSTWYHIAAVRNGSTITLYVNGTSVGSYTNSNSIGSVSKTLYIGVQQSPIWYWNGYIDEFRITNGYARYTANFTPPTAAFFNTGPV